MRPGASRKTSPPSGTFAASLFPRLEKFDRVSGRIFADDLPTARPLNGVGAETAALGDEVPYGGLDIGDFDDESIPAPRVRFGAIGQRLRCRRSGPAHPKREVAKLHRGKRRPPSISEHEAERRIERDRSVDVRYEVAHDGHERLLLTCLPRRHCSAR